MKPTPPGWPRIASALYYEDARRAIDFLCAAFGFEVRILVDGPEGRVAHSELSFGGGLVMVGEVHGKTETFPSRRAPGQVGGGNTQSLMVYVDDVEEHYRRATAAGVKIHAEMSTVDYGDAYWSDRGYECEDIGGHHWWFYQRLRTSPSQS